MNHGCSLTLQSCMGSFCYKVSMKMNECGKSMVIFLLSEPRVDTLALRHWPQTLWQIMAVLKI